MPEPLQEGSKRLYAQKYEQFPEYCGGTFPMNIHMCRSAILRVARFHCKEINIDRLNIPAVGLG
jgi:hypothetical protein